MGGECSTWVTNSQIMTWGRESFTNAFSSNLNTLNLKIFADHGGICTWAFQIVLKERGNSRIRGKTGRKQIFVEI